MTSCVRANTYTAIINSSDSGINASSDEKIFNSGMSTVLQEEMYENPRHISHADLPLPATAATDLFDFDDGYDSDCSYHTAVCTVNDGVSTLIDSKTLKIETVKGLQDHFERIVPIVGQIYLCLQRMADELQIRQKVNQHILASKLVRPVKMKQKYSHEHQLSVHDLQNLAKLKLLKQQNP